MNPDEFKEVIASQSDRRETQQEPAATVLIVTFNSGTAVLDLYKSLSSQTFSAFETIIINNGRISPEIIKQIKELPVLYLESRKNSVSLGRNMGSAFARSAFLIFLDDDCLAHPDLVKAHLDCYRDDTVRGVRGKALPKTQAFFHNFQAHYDLGPQILPAVISLEGNCSLRKEVFDRVGGYDPQIFGAEGLDLSYRIVRQYGQDDAILYSPAPVIYHDYASGLLDYLEKCYRHPKMRARLLRQFPDIIAFGRKYGPYPNTGQRSTSFLKKILIGLVGLLGTTAEKLGKYSA